MTQFSVASNLTNRERDIHQSAALSQKISHFFLHLSIVNCCLVILSLRNSSSLFSWSWRSFVARRKSCSSWFSRFEATLYAIKRILVCEATFVYFMIEVSLIFRISRSEFEEWKRRLWTCAIVADEILATAFFVSVDRDKVSWSRWPTAKEHSATTATMSSSSRYSSTISWSSRSCQRTRETRVTCT